MANRYDIFNQIYVAKKNKKQFYFAGLFIFPGAGESGSSKGQSKIFRECKVLT